MPTFKGDGWGIRLIRLFPIFETHSRDCLACTVDKGPFCVLATRIRNGHPEVIVNVSPPFLAGLCGDERTAWLEEIGRILGAGTGVIVGRVDKVGGGGKRRLLTDLKPRSKVGCRNDRSGIQQYID